MIETVRKQLDMSEAELWDRYRASGGALTRDVISAFLCGASTITKEDIDSLALVLRDRFTGESSESHLPDLA